MWRFTRPIKQKEEVSRSPSHSLVPQLPVPSVLLGIDGLVVGPAGSLQEAEARVSTHGGVHLIAWTQRGRSVALQHLLSVGSEERTLHPPCLKTPASRERSASASHQPAGTSCCSISGIQMSTSLKSTTHSVTHCLELLAQPLAVAMEGGVVPDVSSFQDGLGMFPDHLLLQVVEHAHPQQHPGDTEQG